MESVEGQVLERCTLRFVSPILSPDTEADIQKLMQKTNVFLFGSNETKGLPEIILSLGHRKDLFLILFCFVCELGRTGALPEFGEETWRCFRKIVFFACFETRSSFCAELLGVASAIFPVTQLVP